MSAIYDPNGQAITIGALVDLINSQRQIIKEQREDLTKKIKESHGMAHVVIESGFYPGVDSSCRCDECREVCPGMSEAGYLDAVKDRWWEETEVTNGQPGWLFGQANCCPKNNQRKPME